MEIQEVVVLFDSDDEGVSCPGKPSPQFVSPIFIQLTYAPQIIIPLDI
jgi:hypothetical protein